jgi:hypothetical protein
MLAYVWLPNNGMVASLLLFPKGVTMSDLTMGTDADYITDVLSRDLWLF